MDLRLLDAADIPREEVEEGVDDEEETGGDTNEDIIIYIYMLG